MKKLLQNKVIVTIISLLWGATLYCDHPSWAAGEIVSPSSQVTDATLKRFYILNRTDPHLDLLHKLYNAHHTHLDHLYQHITTVPSDNNLIQLIVKEIAHKRELTHFFDAYNKYKNYQFIENEAIDKEFTILIDHITNFFLALPHLTQETRKTLLLNSTLTKELEVAYNPAIIFRFYFLKRTDHVVKHMAQVLKKDKPLDLKIPQFKDERINRCGQEILTVKNINPYLQLYKEIEQYHYLDNVTFQHEFLVLTCALLDCIQRRDPHTKDSDIDSFKKYSIKELLDSLNSIDHHHLLDFQSTPAHGAPIEEQQSLESLIQSTFNLSTDEFCNLVLRRYYFINRLSFIDQFPSMKNAVHSSELKLRLLLSEWKNFKRYMFLPDQLVIDSFSDEIFLIAAEIPNKSQFLNGSFITLESADSTEEESSALHDLESFIDIDSVVLRLYHIKRLENVMKQIAFFDNATLSFNDNSISNFSHPATQRCLTHIKKSNSITPFLLLSKEFESYFYIRDDNFLREYLTLLHQCHLYLLQHLNNPRNTNLKTIPSGTIKKKIIEQLSIGELFDKIDSASMQLAHYHKLNRQRPWLNFLKKILFLHRLSKLWYYFLA